MKTLLLFFLSCVLIFPQQTVEADLDSAFFNMKRGIYWALSNIDPAKNSLSKELIADNKLLAQVKVSKEIDGIKIESTGFYFSAEVSAKVYRSEIFLEREGYLKKVIPIEPEKKKRKKKDL